MNLKKDEQGSILVSTFGLLLFISFLITTATIVIKHQVIQYNLITHTYEAKAMIEMSKHIILEEGNEDISEGSLSFSNGTVTVKRTNGRSYTLEAKLDNDFRSQSKLELPEPINEEIDESTYFDE